MHADQAGRAARFQERDPDARILAQPRSDEAAGAATSVDDSVSLERCRAPHLALLRRAAEEESRRQPEGVQNVVHAAARWYSRVRPPSRSWRSIVQVFGCKSWRLVVRAGAARLPGRARRRNAPCRRATPARAGHRPTTSMRVPKFGFACKPCHFSRMLTIFALHSRHGALRPDRATVGRTFATKSSAVWMDSVAYSASDRRRQLRTAQKDGPRLTLRGGSAATVWPTTSPGLGRARYPRRPGCGCRSTGVSRY